MLGFLDDDFGRQAARHGEKLEDFPDAPPAFIQGFNDEIKKMNGDDDGWDHVHVSVFQM